MDKNLHFALNLTALNLSSNSMSTFANSITGFCDSFINNSFWKSNEKLTGIFSQKNSFICGSAVCCFCYLSVPLL